MLGSSRSSSAWAIAVSLLSTGCLFSAGCNGQAQLEAARRAEAEAQVAAFADRLRQQVTPTASFERIDPADVKELDPWGQRLQLTYYQGGVTETFEVRSIGGDGRRQTEDDIVRTGTLLNFKGVGRAVRDGVSETAANAAKGVVKGTVEGVKEAAAETASAAKETLSDAARKLRGKNDQE